MHCHALTWFPDQESKMSEQMDDDEIATLFATDEDDYPTKFPLSYQEIENC
jgi:hypothetical protein